MNPVRNSSRYDSKPSEALDPAGIIVGPNPAAEPCTAWCTGQSNGASFISNGVKKKWFRYLNILNRPDGLKENNKKGGHFAPP